MSLVPRPATVGRPSVLLLLAILAAAAAVRVPMLGLYGQDPDEIWGTELAMGHGSVHLDLPWNVPMAAPDPLDPSRAAPIWHVWTTLETTHPPLFYLLLRGWVAALGTGDATERLFSAAASVLAVAVLFDVVRLLNGTRPALWAALLMALAEPQVSYGRLNRNYALFMLVALLLADAVVRLERSGPTRRRLLTVAGLALATMLTHYFCIGFLAAAFAYAVVRGRDRRRIAAAFAAAGVVFAVAWGPFLWRQRHLFSAADAGMLFLNDAAPGHAGRTVRQFLLVPGEMLVGLDRRFVTVAAVAALLYPASLLLVRRRPDLLLWTLWLFAAPGVVLVLDLARHTTHLSYTRYTLLAGPAVCALTAALARHRLLGQIIPAAAVVACAVALPLAYDPPGTVDPHAVQRRFQSAVAPDDLMLFVATGDRQWAAGTNYLMVSRYFEPAPRRIALLDRPASPSLLAEARRRPRTLVFTKTEDARAFLPGFDAADVAECQGRGILWVMTPRPTP